MASAVASTSNGVNGHAQADDEGIDYSEIEQKYAPRLSQPLEAAILIEGAPKVGLDRRDKLLQVIQKAFQKAGFRVKVDDMDMPMTEENQSQGFLFVAFDDPTVAEQAAHAMNNYPFDKRHTLTVLTFAEVDRVQEVQGEWTDAPMQPFTPREHLRQWLGDDMGRDQVLTLRGESLQVAWLERKGSVTPVEQRENWTELYASWSPLGTLVATIHSLGVATWGGSSFSKIHRYAHPGVKLIDFSPNEKYLVTWSPHPLKLPADHATNPRIPFSAEDEGNQIVIWETFTGKVLRSFPMLPPPPGATEESAKVVRWPAFKWSGDEKYFARVVPGQQINVYETPSMAMVDKKSVKIEGVVDFEWAPLGSKDYAYDDSVKAGKQTKPRQNVLAYWVPEIANQPARVTLMAMPSREALRSKNLFNVSDCKIFWQSAGDYLCIKVDRHTRSKKTIFTNLEVFRLRDKSYPVETIETKDAVTAFSWEPKGDRFAMITTNDPMLGQTGPGATLKTAVSFYQLDPRKGDFRLLRTFDNKTSSYITWSPKGRHVVLATLGSTTKSDIEFWDLELDSVTGTAIVDKAASSAASAKNADPAAAIALIHTVDHYGATEVDWDPSGRYVVVAGTIWNSSMEAGYAIYDFRGQELDKHQLDKFKQILFRPRPRTLLSKEQQDAVRRNFKDYSRRYDEIDQALASTASSEVLEARRRAMAEWNTWRRDTRARVEEMRVEMGKPPVGSGSKAEEAEEQTEAVEETVEVVVSETIEIVE